MNLAAAIHARLTGDAALTALLSTYGGGPAVFTADPVPADAVLPYIVTAGDVTSAPADTKTTRGRDLQRDVRCYDEATGSAVNVDAIAERVHALLHRHCLVVADHVTVTAACSGPVAGPDEDDAYGRIVAVRLLVEQA